MATGAITITAGKTWDAINGEIVDLSKMNKAANPTARVNENTVGRRELITAFVTEHDDVIAGLVTEQTVRADADTAISATVTALTATVGSNTAAISAESSARATADGYLEGKYSLTATAGHVVTGLNITSASGAGTEISEVAFQADRFLIYTSSGGNKQLFEATTTAVKLGDVLTVDLAGQAIYIGAGNYGNADTGFFVDAAGRFSLKDNFTWDGSALNIVSDQVIIGVATDVTGYELQVDGDMLLREVGAGAINASYFASVSGGTLASPTATIAESFVGFGLRGYDGTSWVSGSHMRIKAQATWSGSGTPTYIEFLTNTTAGNNYFYLSHDGKLEFGSARDTNLYRSAANTLVTDDNFTAPTITADNGTGESVSIAAQGAYATIEMVGDTGGLIDLRPTATADYKLRLLADSTEAAVRTVSGTDLFLDAVSANVKFGTHSAIGAETVTGFITIKDSGGTTRKLAVIS